jgi:hypothetical protein
MSFIRDFDNWELKLVDSSFDILYSRIPRREGPDQMSWRSNDNGRFDVRSYYVTLKGLGEACFP